MLSSPASVSPAHSRTRSAVGLRLWARIAISHATIGTLGHAWQWAKWKNELAGPAAAKCEFIAFILPIAIAKIALQL